MIPIGQSILDVELVGLETRSLVIAGEGGDFFSLPKRLLPLISEAILVNIKRENILNKYNPPNFYIYLNILKTLRFVNCEFSTLKHVSSLFLSFSLLFSFIF